jgi:hypothetical protein
VSKDVILWPLVVLVMAGVAAAQEKKKPSDSTELVATGCIKGRVFTAMDNPEEQGAVMRGRSVRGRSFRITGKRDVMDEVKRQDGHFVEVTGLVRTSELEGRGPAMRIGGTDVNIGVTPMDPTRPTGTQQALTNVVVMDVTAVRFVAESCPK